MARTASDILNDPRTKSRGTRAILIGLMEGITDRSTLQSQVVTAYQYSTGVHRTPSYARREAMKSFRWLNKNGFSFLEQVSPADVEIKVDYGAPDDESQTPKLTPENIDEFADKLTDPDSPETVTVTK